MLLPTLPYQSTSHFDLDSSHLLTISSQFDSGNIKIIRQVSTSFYLSCAADNESLDSQSNTRSWFYFSVSTNQATKCKFNIQKVQCLLPLAEGRSVDVYKPVVKENGKWGRLKSECVLRKSNSQMVEITFQYQFQPDSTVYFAFCYPFSYQQNLDYISKLDHSFLKHSHFYYHSEVIAKSPEERLIHLITITSHSHQAGSQEPIFNQHLFPEKNRPLMFNKPVVLISARIHPGETPSSYAMMGMVNFLTSSDARALILREMFVFMIVPMINVDGVFRGNFRMDVYGQNLNRYYIDPDILKQPAPFAIKKLAQNLHQNNRLSFYFDIHAHNSKKGCFMYGNAIDNFIDQVQTSTFCKLISMNTPFFEYSNCTFSTKHMKIKDRFQDLSKEGCARVVMHKLTGIIHSYCLECGSISSNSLNQLNPVSNKQFQVGENVCFEEKVLEDEKSLWCVPEMYEDVGRAVLISILDTFDKNPFSRMNSICNETLSTLRREVAFQVFHNAERFRMHQKNLFTKVRDINQLVRNNFKCRFSSRIFQVQYSQMFKNVTFPLGIQGLQKTIKAQTHHFDRLLNKSTRISKQTITRYVQRKPLSHTSKIFKEQEFQSTAIESNTILDELETIIQPSNPNVSPKNTRFSLIKESSHRRTQIGLLKNIIEEPLRYPSITEESRRRQPITVELKTKLSTSVKQQLKTQLREQSRGFLQDTREARQKNYLVFSKHQQKPKNGMYYMRQRKTVSQRITSMKRNSKRQKTRVTEGDDSDSYLLMNIHHSVSKFYREIQNTLNSQRKKLGGSKEHYSEIINNRLSDSLGRLNIGNGGKKRELRLPRLPEQAFPNKSQLVSNVEIVLVDDKKGLNKSSVLMSERMRKGEGQWERGREKEKQRLGRQPV